MEHIPSSEQRWVTIRNKNKENYHVITSKKNNRERYYIYNCQNGIAQKLGSAKTPIDLETQWPL